MFPVAATPEIVGAAGCETFTGGTVLDEVPPPHPASTITPAVIKQAVNFGRAKVVGDFIECPEVGTAKNLPSAIPAGKPI